jgi:Divergent InlB B-repeat domain
VQANFIGWVQNNGNNGNVKAELAKADAAGDCSNPTLIYTSNEALLQYPNTEISGSFTGLYPGGAYCWRLVANVVNGVSQGTYNGNWEYFATIGNYLTGQSGQYVPPPAHPTDVQQCSSNGSGCSTSNCQTGSTCNSNGGLGGLSHKLTIALGGSKAGRVSGPGGISCPSTCSHTYPTGSSTHVTLTATPNAGQKFVGWSGGGCSGTGTCSLTMNADHAVTAIFAALPKPVAKCTISALSKSVHLKKTKHGGKPGTLTFKITCNQQANLSLTAVLKEELSKSKTKTFHLGPVHGTARPGSTTKLTLKLPKAALKGLSKHRKESLAVSLSAKNANGTGHARTTISSIGHSG